MTPQECIQAINDAAETCIHQMIDIEISIPAEAYTEEVYKCVREWGSLSGNFSEYVEHILLWPHSQVRPGAHNVQINLVKSGVSHEAFSGYWGE